jgi:hypothetical protein
MMVESKIEFFIVVAFIMTASTGQPYPVSNFISRFNPVLGFM